MGLRKPVQSVAALLAITLSPSVEAREVLGATSLARGAITVSDPRDEAAISHSPAVLALEPRYDFSAHLGLGPDGAWEGSGSGWDSRESPITFGLQYRRLVHEPPLRTEDLPGWRAADEELTNVERWHDINGAVALPLFDRRLALGVGGSVSFLDHDRPAPPRQTDFLAGIAARPLPQLHTAVAVRNLMPHEPLVVGAGALFRIQDEGSAALEADFDLETGLSVRGGLDLEFPTFRLRTGAHWPGVGELLQIGGGFGLDAGEAAVEYGVSLPPGDLRLGALTHRIAFRLRT